MAIQELTISNFRNLNNVSLTPARHLNILVGANASGKTNFLEAIYFLGTARSFRTIQSKQLINFESQDFVLFTRINQGGTIFPIGISRNKQNTTIKIAQRFATSAAELASLLPVQVINPDTHKLMEEGPRYRRRFIEWGVFHVKHGYMDTWQKCRHILKQRNAALKNHWARKAIQQWDLALINVSSEITAIRNEYIQQLLPYVNQFISDVGDLPTLDFSLYQGWPASENLQELLQASWETDKRKGITQYGPHRSDLRIRIKGYAAKDIVSRGQQKIITALLKLGQLKLLENAYPEMTSLLLIDDLPAELDQRYRQALMALITVSRSQVFMTTTDSKFIDVDALDVEHCMFHVKQGKISVIATNGEYVATS
ncbi:MAG: DNA replication/repair protein RecF [Gammaproteobacteria bacterium]|nr:DNA replication/repair protein RecF [Gammaproteobacteria bacterium]